MQSFRGIVLLGILATVAVAASGCGRGGQPRTYRVQGTVTYRGQPLAEAHVRFIPESGPPAEGVTDPSGAFELQTFRPGDGAVAGKHTVTVSKTQVVDSDPNAAYPVMRSVLPDRYGRVTTSPLSVEVTAGGENRFELPLDP